MTHDLVERMVGHRTRLAQEAPEHWHDGEEQAIVHYLGLARALDRRATLLLALVPRGWPVLGLLGLAPAFVSDQSAPVALAVGLGGTLLAYRALHKLAAGLVHLTGAVLAWQQIAPLLAAAPRTEVMGAPDFALRVRTTREQRHRRVPAHRGARSRLPLPRAWCSGPAGLLSLHPRG